MVLGKTACKGYCAEHNVWVSRFPLLCANMHSSLDREQADDDEVWYSASSDVEEGRKQVVTCSQGGPLGVQEQLSVSPSDRVLPGQSVPTGALCDN
eukprot:1740300-Amphidinium_carterae.1